MTPYTGICPAIATTAEGVHIIAATVLARSGLEVMYHWQMYTSYCVMYQGLLPQCKSENAASAIQIEGKENLPAADSPAVYVANHQSFMVRAKPNSVLRYQLMQACAGMMHAQYVHFSGAATICVVDVT